MAKEDTGVTAPKKPETAQVANINGIDKLEPPKTKEETESSKSVSSEKAAHASDESFKRSIHEASYVGWKQIGGWEDKDELTLDDELMDMTRETFLDNIIPDSLYGDWYHSVAIFFIGGVASFALGHYKFSMGSAFFVIVITSLLYRTSAKIQRFHKRVSPERVHGAESGKRL
ncbi:CBM_collapsed_G0053310.mRNA.1.CDS.1 [Saccharomyces cerevisiae]|nr:CBM_collapsed_G0053310.mRNA.1.CDS.1 [Saccharomyces cerevisiae]